MFVLIISTGVLATCHIANVAIAAQEEMIVSHKGTATVKAVDMNQGHCEVSQ